MNLEPLRQSAVTLFLGATAFLPGATEQSVVTVLIIVSGAFVFLCYADSVYAYLLLVTLSEGVHAC